MTLNTNTIPNPNPNPNPDTGLVGEAGAQEHAKATGHINFAEYR